MEYLRSIWKEEILAYKEMLKKNMKKNVKKISKINRIDPVRVDKLLELYH